MSTEAVGGAGAFIPGGSSIIISNEEGWKLTLTQVDETCRIILTDKSDHPQDFSCSEFGSVDLLGREIIRLTSGEEFGFEVQEEFGKYSLVFCSFKHEAGSRSRDLLFGVTIVILGAGLVWNRKVHRVPSGVVFASGSAVVRYATTTPDNKYSRRACATEGVTGALGGLVGGGVSTYVPAAGWIATTARNLASTVASTFAQTGYKERRLPKGKELGAATAAGLAGSLAQTCTKMALDVLTNNWFTSLFGRAFVGSVSGATGGAASNTASNYLKEEGPSLTDGLGVSMLSGGFSGAVYDVRGELDRRAKIEEAAREEAAQKKPDEKPPEAKKKPEADKQPDVNTARESQAIELQDEEGRVALLEKSVKDAIEGSRGLKVRDLFFRGYRPKDQRINTAEEALKQIAMGHELNFHKKDKHEVVSDPSQKGNYWEAEAQRRSLEVKKAQFSNSPPPPSESKREAPKAAEPSSGAPKENGKPEGQGDDFSNRAAKLDAREQELNMREQGILQAVKVELGEKVSESQRKGYRIGDDSLNGNVQAILQQLAKGEHIAFKKGEKRHYVHSKIAPEAQQKLAEQREALSWDRAALERDKRAANLTSSDIHTIKSQITTIEQWRNDILARTDKQYGEKVDILLRDKFRLTDQRHNTRAKIIEQLAYGHELHFHHPKDKSKDFTLKSDLFTFDGPTGRKKHEALRGYHDLLAAHERQLQEEAAKNRPAGGSAPDPTDFSLEGRGKQLDYAEQKINRMRQGILPKVRLEKQDEVTELQRCGYRVIDDSINGNVEKILEQLAMGHHITFKKGDERVYMESSEAKKAIKEIKQAETNLAKARANLLSDTKLSKYDRVHTLRQQEQRIQGVEKEGAQSLDKAVLEVQMLQVKGYKLTKSWLERDIDEVRWKLAEGETLFLEKDSHNKKDPHKKQVSVEGFKERSKKLDGLKLENETAKKAYHADFSGKEER